MFSKKNKPKIFCISFQRTGTTSVGEFFMKQGYPVATWYVSKENEWTKSWIDGDYEKIFSSRDFINKQVFEDDPWWCLDFYKVLYHRFPDAKFVFFTRDSNKWFDSMVSHSKGKTLGNGYRHTKIYRRESEFYKKIGDQIKTYDCDKIDNLLDLDESHRKHYVEIYDIRNKEVLEFFRSHDPSRFIALQLEDKNKWQKLGAFFNIKISPEFEVHANNSNRA